MTFKAASITNLQQWLSTDENRLVARVNWSCARSGGQPFSDPLPPFSPSPSSASLPTPTRKTRRPHLHNIDCTAIQCIFVGLCHLLLSCGGSPAVPDCHVEVNPPSRRRNNSKALVLYARCEVR